jgi:hypothetical protein
VRCSQEKQFFCFGSDWLGLFKWLSNKRRHVLSILCDTIWQGIAYFFPLGLSFGLPWFGTLRRLLKVRKIHDLYQRDLLKKRKKVFSQNDSLCAGGWSKVPLIMM